MKNVKNSIKKFMTFRVIIILCNHYFIILNFFQEIKFFIVNQIKLMGLKLGNDFTTYGKFTDTSWI